jgi:hypothetical protein
MFFCNFWFFINFISAILIFLPNSITHSTYMWQKATSKLLRTKGTQLNAIMNWNLREFMSKELDDEEKEVENWRIFFSSRVELRLYCLYGWHVVSWFSLSWSFFCVQVLWEKFLVKLIVGHVTVYLICWILWCSM